MTPHPRRGGTRPGAGRPPLSASGEEARSVRVVVYLTPTETQRVDEARGDASRGAWLVEAAGLRSE